MKKITIYTDGACSGNPGIGGWGAIIFEGNNRIDLSGREEYTTNNRMELLAAINALNSLSESNVVDIFTDSQYVQKGMSQWIHNWTKRGWKTSNNKPVKNADLWQKLLNLCTKHQVTWHWIEGHAGHEFNEQVDTLARRQCQIK